MDFSPVWISLKTTVCASVITFVIGILAAWAVMFIKGRKLKAAVDGILTIPLVLPPTVAGFFLLWLFGARRPIGSFVEEVFGFRIAFSWVATVLSAVVVSFPLMYRSAKAGFEQIDQNIIYGLICIHSKFSFLSLRADYNHVSACALSAFVRTVTAALHAHSSR